MLWIFEETEDVDVVHQHLPHGGDEVGKSPAPFHLSVYHSQQQIGNQADPYLGLDGVYALAVEILQREVLFQLLEEQLDLPSVVVDIDDFPLREVEVVGQQRGVLSVVGPVLYHTGGVHDTVLGELHFADRHLNEAVGSHQRCG